MSQAAPSKAGTVSGPAKVFAIFSSFGMTCVLLLLLFLLTLLGTLEQVQYGLFEVQKKYFESLFLIHWVGGKVPLPLPGAILVQGLLALNLLCGGFVRLIQVNDREWSLAPRLFAIATGVAVGLGVGLALGHGVEAMLDLGYGAAWTESCAGTGIAWGLGFGVGIGLLRHRPALVGVIVAHLGIVMLLLAGFVKLYFSEDGQLTLVEGQSSAEFVSYFEWEVAVFDASERKKVTEWIIPGEHFEDLRGEKTRRFTSDKLPFSLTLSNFVRNCVVAHEVDIPPQGRRLPLVENYALVPQHPENEAEKNVAGCYVSVESKGSAQRGILWHYARLPYSVQAGGKWWAIILRKRHFSLPFHVLLTKFTHEKYPGTEIPKVFMSDVIKLEGEQSQPFKIQMNEPLREGGFTLFQASYGALPDGRPFSVLAVVRNPSDHWPLAACVVIGLGLSWVFVLKLVGYVSSQAPKRRAAPATTHGNEVKA